MVKKQETFIDVRGGVLYIWGFIRSNINMKQFMDRGGEVILGNPDNPGAVTIDGADLSVGGNMKLTACPGTKIKPRPKHTK